MFYFTLPIDLSLAISYIVQDLNELCKIHKSHSISRFASALNSDSGESEPVGRSADDSSAASPLTCFIVVVSSILNSPEDARQARLADAVLAEEDHLVHLGLCLAAGGDDRVRGVRGAAAPVLLVGGVGRAAQQVGQLVCLSGLWHRGAKVPVVHGHAPPVQVGEIHGKRHAASPLVHVPQFVTLVQSHCACAARLWMDETHA